MLFVMILEWQPGLSKEQIDGALGRRAQWNYPEGVRLIGEYWPMSADVPVLSIFETDDHAALMEITFTWGDVFKIDMHPAVSAEDGLRLGPDAMARAQGAMPGAG
jgi:hypothetical protein